MRKYKEFIEDHFWIRDKEFNVVPFILNVPQQKYYQMLLDTYGMAPKGVAGFNGAREIILKARQEGFTSLIEAMFTADFLETPNSVSICIAHDRESTKKLFSKVHFYIDSYLKTKLKEENIDVNESTLNGARKYLLETDSKTEIRNKLNGAEFYIKTAGAKVGARGDTAKNILFSECAFYSDTDILSADEIIEGSLQQVPQDFGMVFIESTANGVGNYYHKTWELAERGASIFVPRFFSWRENPEYTEEYMATKRKEFTTEDMFLQEYPDTPEQAFILSGNPFFDKTTLFQINQFAGERQPIYQGSLLKRNA